MRPGRAVGRVGLDDVLVGGYAVDPVVGWLRGGAESRVRGVKAFGEYVEAVM